MTNLSMKFLSIILAILLIGITHAQLADSPSPTLKINSKHNGLSPYATNIEEPYVKWKFDTGNGVESSPAIGSDGTIYVGTFSDNFYAINPDGTLKWKFTREGEHFRSSPTLDQDGTIYVIAAVDLRPLYNPTLDSYEDMFGIPTLYALNPDGTLKWEFTAGGLASGILYSPAIAEDGTIYMISGGAKKGGTTDDPDVLRGDTFWAINPDGTEKWHFDTGDAMYSAPALADDGTIYFGCADGYFYALTPEGEEKWKFAGENPTEYNSFNSVPSIGPDGTIYAGSRDKVLYALSPEGEMKWKFFMDDTVEATPSIASDGTIYAGAYSPGKDKYLYALNSDGTEKWRFETGEGVYGGPVIDANGILYFGSYDKYLYSLNPDGTERWRYKIGGGIIMPPVIDANGTLYVSSWDHHLYAITGSVDEEQGDLEDELDEEELENEFEEPVSPQPLEENVYEEQEGSSEDADQIETEPSEEKEEDIFLLILVVIVIIVMAILISKIKFKK